MRRKSIIALLLASGIVITTVSHQTHTTSEVSQITPTAMAQEKIYLTKQEKFDKLYEERKKEIEEEKRKEEERFNHLVNVIIEQNKEVTQEDAKLIINTIRTEMPKYKYIDDEQVVLAQIKQESNFQKNLVCKDGDTGLMQLIPSTGREIASKMGILNYNGEMRKDIKMNIKMGMWYLNDCLTRADKLTQDPQKRLRVALVAYNVGPRAYSTFKAKGTYRNNYHNDVLRHYDLFN